MAFFIPQNVRILLTHEIERVFHEFKKELTETLREQNLPAVGVQRTHINTVRDIPEGIEIEIKNDISMEGTFLPVQKIKHFAQKIDGARAGNGNFYRRCHLIISCQMHNDQIIDAGLFVHLRKKHNASSAGKKKFNTQPTDLTDLFLEMTKTNIRELIYRAIKVEFINMVDKLKRLNIFELEVPIMYSKIIRKELEPAVHVIVVKVPDRCVKPQLIENIPLNVPIDIFVPVNIAIYNDDNELKEILVNSIEYMVGELIGVGAFGKCYKLTTSKNAKNAELACKVIEKKNRSGIDFSKMTQNEVEILEELRELQHQNIVEYIASFEDKHRKFILMGLCANNLNDVIQMQNFFELDQCCCLISQVLAGADFLHRHQIIHRDIKLHNILIDHNQNVKLCDFGVSIKTNASPEELRILCGTIGYIAPEIVCGHGALTKSDIWSIAVMFYFMYKGQRPFDGLSNDENSQMVYNRIKNARYSTDFYDDPLLVHFFSQTFQRDPYDRPSANECLEMRIFANKLRKSSLFLNLFFIHKL